jgi:hypothetical protein
MGERTKADDSKHEAIIAAFDRERDEAHELSRRHSEQVINSRRNDRPVRPDTLERRHPDSRRRHP